MPRYGHGAGVPGGLSPGLGGRGRRRRALDGGATRPHCSRQGPRSDSPTDTPALSLKKAEMSATGELASQTPCNQARRVAPWFTCIHTQMGPHVCSMSPNTRALVRACLRAHSWSRCAGVRVSHPHRHPRPRARRCARVSNRNRYACVHACVFVRVFTRTQVHVNLHS